MSIIIHFNAASFIPPSANLSATPSYVSRARTKLAMVPGIDQTDRTVMTDDESSMVDIATSNTLYTHTVDLKSSNHVLGSCFGLPYQDHNYGAPPPPTPPSYSPCTSPAHANGVPDEDTNLSVVSTSTANEETQEGSITRCICGFEHDDEYMICCDLCLVWQHVDCMGLDRNNIPETYLCEKCEPRKVDKHKAKVLQTRKKVAMTDSSDSDEDTVKNVERKQKTRKRKRKEEEKNDDKSEQGPGKRSKQVHKSKNKESTSTADEEAQDAWEISLEWCEKNFESAVNNQYTPEVQHLSKALQIMGHEERFMELLLTRNCQVIDENPKKLVSVFDIPRDQPLIEYKGKFLLASQFYDLHPAFSRRLFPYVMFYTMDQEELCVDASLYGNEARFVRRSCKPNAELRHLVHNGNLHLYISSTKAVFKDDEITLPLDFSLKESIRDMECTCDSEDCILKFHEKNGNIDMSLEKKKRGRKLTFSADDDSSHSFVGINISLTKTKPSVKSTSESMEGKSDHETEEQANERKKKTREERKIDAIMRAFDQMEKAAKRRQQALERQKAHHPKPEETSEKSESVNSSKEDDKGTTASGSETQGGEEEKSHIPTPKPKKGKRRRGSGTSGKRRTRTNSGGSDILSPEENVLLKNVLTINTDTISNSDTNVEAVTTSSTTVLSPVSSISATSPIVLKTKRFLLHEWLQEKSETNTNPSTTSPVSIRTEVKWNTSAASSTCYVQCTKDNPHSGGISAAHLRRSSTSSQIKSIPLKSCTEQGFTKKRWLRQAMYDCNTCGPLTIDPGSIEGLHLDNDYLSPPVHGEMGSPGAADDTVTPLKKRRQIRESIESTSPLSPSIQNSECCSVSALNSDINTESKLNDSDQCLLSVKADSSSSNLSSASKEEIFLKMNGLNVESPESAKIADIKKEASESETLISASILTECQVSFETLSSSVISTLKGVESSMQNNSDLEDITLDSVKNDCVKENNLDLPQNICKSNYADASNADKFSDKNLQTRKRHSTEKYEESGMFDSTNLYNNGEEKVSDDCNIQPSTYSDDNCSNFTRINSPELKEICVSDSDLKDMIPLETGADNFVSNKLNEDNVHKVLSNSSSVHFANCESTKDNFSDSFPQYPELHSSISPVKNINVSISVPLDCKNEQMDVTILPKKVSLSEYRMRMKDGSNKRLGCENIKRCKSSPALSATAIPETLPEQVTLAPLPLFDTTVGSKSPIQTFVKSPKKKQEITKSEESCNDVTEHRENLTERLKREFGFDDDSEGPSASNHAKPTCGSTSTLPLCAQPPPPPPPPRPVRLSTNLNTTTAASPSQFGFPMPTSYARPSYIVPQVPSAQFIPVQQTVNTPVMSSIHPLTNPSVQCNGQTALLPSPHSFAPSLAGTVLRPPIQHEYSSVNAQNFAALVQQPPPPKSYSHVYQSRLYK